MSPPGSPPRARPGGAPSVRFGPADLGRRLTLRVLTTDEHGGSVPTDVVGVLENWHRGVLTLRRRDGEAVEVPVASVAGGHVVAPELSADDLSEIADDTWRARETQLVGRWRLREHGGVTHRPNSALAVGDPGASVEDALAAVEVWYERRGLPPTVMTPLPALVAHVAESLGWRQERRTLVLAAPADALAAQPAPLPDGVRVELTSSLPDDWDEVLPRLQDPGTAELYRALLTGTPGAAFVTARDPAGSPLGVARGATSGGWTNVTNVEVLPGARRQGLGAGLPVALAGWAAGQGSTHLFLQAWPDNDVALRLYGRLGFVRHHEYAYYVAPG